MIYLYDLYARIYGEPKPEPKTPLIPAIELFEIAVKTKPEEFTQAVWKEMFTLKSPEFKALIKTEVNVDGTPFYCSNDPKVSRELWTMQAHANRIGPENFKEYVDTKFGKGAINIIWKLHELQNYFYTSYNIPMREKDITAFKSYLKSIHYNSLEVEALFKKFKDYADAQPAQQSAYPVDAYALVKVESNDTRLQTVETKDSKSSIKF